MNKKKKKILIDPEELEEKIMLKDVVEEGKKVEKTSDNVYDVDERLAMMEEDSLRDYEEGFMEGYENPQLIECDNCGKLVNIAKAVEWKINKVSHWFCCQKCLDSYLKKKSQP